MVIFYLQKKRRLFRVSALKIFRESLFLLSLCFCFSWLCFFHFLFSCCFNFRLFGFDLFLGCFLYLFGVLFRLGGVFHLLVFVNSLFSRTVILRFLSSNLHFASVLKKYLFAPQGYVYGETCRSTTDPLRFVYAMTFLRFSREVIS